MEDYQINELVISKKYNQVGIIKIIDGDNGFVVSLDEKDPYNYDYHKPEEIEKTPQI